MGKLEKVKVIDRMEILEDGQIQVREATRVLEDGVIISQSFHRHVVAPDSDITKEDQRVKDVCSVVHTKEVKDKYAADKLTKMAVPTSITEDKKL